MPHNQMIMLKAGVENSTILQLELILTAPWSICYVCCSSADGVVQADVSIHVTNKSAYSRFDHICNCSASRADCHAAKYAGCLVLCMGAQMGAEVQHCFKALVMYRGEPQ